MSVKLSRRLTCAALACLAVTPAAQAETLRADDIGLEIQTFAPGDLAGARAALRDFRSGRNNATGAEMQAARSVGFEGLDAWDGTRGTSDPLTPVGRFTSLGGTGRGGSVVNGGTALEIRSDSPMRWSRYSTGAGGTKWLDSNDTRGMRWDVSGPSEFDAVGFLLTDVADVGGVFSVGVNDTLFENVIGANGRERDGAIHLVSIVLPEMTDELTLKLQNDTLDDGFGIDEATVGDVAPVPVPPAAALILTGFGALALVRRRRSRGASGLSADPGPRGA
jgi:hypothetical protein